MALQDQLSGQGQFLFQGRSYLPILFAIPIGVAFYQMQWPLGSHTLHSYWEFICFSVSLSGLFVRVFTIGHTPEGTSGRNTAEQIAEVLNTTGIYSTMRHPLYLGNFLIGLGLVLLPMNGWLSLLYVLAFALYYERIMMAEEAFLEKKFGETFVEWSQQTPAFIPSFTHYVSPALPFSTRNVLKREYTAVAQIAIAFFGMELAEHFIIEHQIHFSPVWTTIAAFGAIQYVLLRFLKRNTQVLQVQGR